jgi:tetratricopeptide (TPR) repeat protein
MAPTKTSYGARWLLILAWSTACASSTQSGLVERVGGMDRRRAFASPTAYEAWLRAELAMNRGEPAEALRQLNLAEMADATDGYLTARRVEILLALGDTQEALSVATRLTEAQPDLAVGWIARATVHCALQDPTRMSESLSRASACDPDDPDVRAAVASLSGADSQQTARAMAQSPDARVGDRMVAARATPLDPAGSLRRTAETRRRSAAVVLAAQADWHGVDSLLSPFVVGDAARVSDRVHVIEARVLDGRPRDAVALMMSLRVGDIASTVRPSERARLWLLAQRPLIAAEEAREVLNTNPDDVMALRVLGHALLRTAHVAEGIEVLARVPLDAPWGQRLLVSRDVLEGHWATRGEIAGTPATASYVAWALCRDDVARALSEQGQHNIADRIRTQGIETLSRFSNASGARDLLRFGRSSALQLRGATTDAMVALRDVETTWGRHRRGAMLARTEHPERSLGDLRERSGDAHEDALADAWIALMAAIHRTSVTDTDARTALAHARHDAPRSPNTLRAAAMFTSDRREAAELTHQASMLDPNSLWNTALLRLLGER